MVRLAKALINSKNVQMFERSNALRIRYCLNRLDYSAIKFFHPFIQHPGIKKGSTLSALPQFISVQQINLAPSRMGELSRARSSVNG